MNRTTFRNIWLLLMLVMVGLSFLVFRQGQTEQDNIANYTFQLNALKAELENAAKRAVALEELDKLTINEKTATRLDILRHLGLEQSGYDFQVNARQVKVVGESNLDLRVVQLQANMSYDDSMNLMDRLHETKKIVISKIELRKSSESGDKVYLILEGTIYGLEKNDIS